MNKLTNGKLIDLFRKVERADYPVCCKCPITNACDDAGGSCLFGCAADALEAAEKQIAAMGLDITMLRNTISADKGVMLERIRYLEKHQTKEAEWIEPKELSERCKGKAVCSGCGSQVCSIDVTNEHIRIMNHKTRFCPNCGAMMRKNGEQFENDPVMKDIKDGRGLKPIITDGKNGLLHIE